MSISTNRLEINFNIDAIKQDFLFIRLERQQDDKWYGAKELDRLISQDFNAVAVMFQYSKYAYAMFNKPISFYQLKSRITENEEFKNNAVIEVFPKAILDLAEDCICEAWLAQILLNSLASSKSRFAKYHYCNLTGSLLLVQDFKGKNKGYLDVAKITLSSDYLLDVKMVRYRQKISILSELKKTVDGKRKQELQNALSRPHYILEASTSTLRRHLPRDLESDPKSTYIECGLKGKKASALFLEFDSIDNFYKSRSGIFYHVMTRIKSDLSKYMNIDFYSREITEDIPIINTLINKAQNLHFLLDNQLIHIVDTVNNEESANLVITLKELFLPYVTDEKLITCGKLDKQNALNVRIIHDANFYEKMEQEDKYLPSTNKIQRQHITIESNEAVSNAIIKTSIKELLIKRDISCRCLNLFNWNKLQSKGTWTFAAWDEDAKHVIFMEIQPNGKFEFFKIDDLNISNYPPKFARYKEFMTDISSETKIRRLEGLVISDNGDINQIFRTNEITIPELSKIETIIKEVETELPENYQTGNALADLVQEFIDENFQEEQENLDKLLCFSDELRTLDNNEIDKNHFRKLLNDKLGKGTNIASELRNYFLNKYNIRLIFSKQKDNLQDLFDASLNIKYFGETKTEAYYFVGTRKENVQFSFKDACHIRKIVAVDDSNLIFKELLQTMDVDFVRTGQSTVIPFPFKYIREYNNFDTAN